MISEAQDGLQVWQSPPAIESDQVPEAFGKAAVEAFQSGFRGQGDLEGIDLDGFGVVDDGCEGTASAMVSGDEVQAEFRDCLPP